MIIMKRVKGLGWVLCAQTTVKRLKTITKSKDQPTSTHNNNRKIQAMGSITPNMDHYPRNEKTKDSKKQ